MNRDERHAQEKDARRILLTVDRTTKPELLMWAAGLYACGTHAQTVLELVDHTYTQDSGGGCGGGLQYAGNRTHVQFKTFRGEPHDLIGKWTWKQIGGLLRASVDRALVDELRTLRRLRSERIGEWLYAAPRDWCDSPPARKQRRIESTLWHLCYAAGADAWAASRPADNPEAADLLELLAQMAGAS